MMAKSFLLFFPHRAQINSQLLTFFVKMTPLEIKHLGGIGDVEAIALKFRQNRFPLETRDPIR